MSRSLTLVARLAALVLASTLAACGGGSSPAPAPAPAPAPGPAPAPAPAPDTAGNLADTIQPTTYTADSMQALAYAKLNQVRLGGGFGTLKQSPQLDAAAQNQQDYLIQNFALDSGDDWDGVGLYTSVTESDGSITVNAHHQTPGKPGFTAETLGGRLAHFSYIGSAEEVWADYYVRTPAEQANSCLNALLQAPTHRPSLLDPRMREFGIGARTLPNYYPRSTLYGSACTGVTGLLNTAAAGKAPAGWTGVWPADGATTEGVRDLYGHGYAVSLAVSPELTLTTSMFTITDSNGVEVASTINNVEGTVKRNWVFVVADAPLIEGSTYTAHFVGSDNAGHNVERTWSFSTPANAHGL